MTRPLHRWAKCGGSCLKVYDATIAYAGLSDSDKVDTDGGGGGNPPPPSVAVGNYVQWESNGQLQFKVPRRVVELLDDEYARLEGSSSGVLISELTVVDKPIVDPAKPFIGKLDSALIRPLQEGSGMRQEVFSMSEGSVSIEWPASMSAESFEDFKDWLKILERKIGRSVASQGTKNKTDEDAEEILK